MTRKLRAQISEAMRSGEVVRVYRSGLEDGWVDGFVVALGPDYFALEVFDKAVRRDGYNCLRYCDVTSCITPAPHAGYLKRVLAARGQERAKTFSGDVSSLPNLLRGAGARYPLVTIHCEADANVCFIGKIASVERDQVQLLKIGPDAVWDEKATPYSFGDITRVDFGGAYEEALLLAARQR